MPTSSGFATTNAVVTTGLTNPTNAYTDNATYATAVIAAKNTSVSSRYGGFGVSIPAGAIITSVVANVEYFVSTNGSIAQMGVQLQSPSGTGRGTEFNDTAEPLAQTVISQTVLSSSFAWTAADIANGTLFVVVRANNGNNATSVTYSVDYVQVVVDYLLPQKLFMAPMVAP